MPALGDYFSALRHQENATAIPRYTALTPWKSSARPKGVGSRRETPARL
jgi:hypothetical protein